MVHALGESWRILKSGGRMIDIRPQASGWPVSIVTGEQVIHVGRLDDSQRAQQDETTDCAMTKAIENGWFEKEMGDTFGLVYWWNSVEQMKAYIEEEWVNHARIPAEALKKSSELMAMASEGAQIQVTRTIIIARYRKQKA